jgi:hypothetical protein
VPSASRLDAVATPGSFRRCILALPFFKRIFIAWRDWRRLDENGYRAIRRNLNRVGTISLCGPNGDRVTARAAAL